MDLSPEETILKESAAPLGLAITDAHIERFRTYAQELSAWNRRINLTAITAYDAVVLKHFLDSLSVLAALPERGEGFQLIDVGSGAGFPGLPIAITCPDIHVTLLDSVGKKTAFLDHMGRVLELTNITVLTGRAEEVAHRPAHRERYDGVASRAVAALATLAEYLLPLCRVGGRAVAQKRGDLTEELAAAAQAVTLLGGSSATTAPLHLPGLEDDRTLVIMEKLRPTPLSYPRRPGAPAKRPL